MTAATTQTSTVAGLSNPPANPDVPVSTLQRARDADTLLTDTPQTHAAALGPEHPGGHPANAYVEMTRCVRARTGVRYVRTSAAILGKRQIRTFLAMCELAGRRPHELAADIVLKAIGTAQRDHRVQHAVAAVSAALDADLDEAACRMCGCTPERRVPGRLRLGCRPPATGIPVQSVRCCRQLASQTVSNHA
jgi:hypothetical protein